MANEKPIVETVQVKKADGTVKTMYKHLYDALNSKRLLPKGTELVVNTKVEKEKLEKAIEATEKK